MFRPLLLLLLFANCFPHILAAQSNLPQSDSTGQDQITRQAMERLAESARPGADFTDILSQQAQYRSHPLDLNKAGLQELLSLGLPLPQAQSILAHRTTYGDFTDIYELQAVEGLDPETINRIYLYVVVNSPDYTLRDLIRDAGHDVLLRTTGKLELDNPYFLPITNPGRYAGSPEAIYARYLFHRDNRLSIGITMDKDAGEELFGPTQPYGFDFYSFHAYFYAGKDRFIQKIALGDFHILAGQGLVAWSGFAFSKSPDILGTVKFGQGILPSKSANENRLFRGSAITIGNENTNLSLFASGKKLDATGIFYHPGGQSPQQFTGTDETGLHRNYRELYSKKIVPEHIVGLILENKRGNLNLGFTALAGQYGVELIHGKAIYEQNQLQGTDFYSTGPNYTYSYRNIFLYGEAAICHTYDFALIQGMMLSLSRKSQFNLMYRDYGTNYQAPYANAFAEKSGTQNERGIYAGYLYSPGSRLRWNTYMDHYYFPFPRYGEYRPSSGTEVFSEMNLQRRKSREYLIRLQFEKHSINSEGMFSYADPDYNLVRLRAAYSQPLSPSFKMQSRIELSAKTDPFLNTYNGLLAWSELSWRPQFSRTAIHLRLAWYSLEEGSLPIYAYESDMPSSFSIPAFRGQGFRYYFLIQTAAGPHVKLYFRLAQNITYNLDHSTELKFQAHISF